jgi:uncharacterized protein (DUF697 family)
MFAASAGFFPGIATTPRSKNAEPDDFNALAAECRRLVRRRALWSAASSFVPIPGIDFITDVAVLSRLIADINARFGVTDEALARGSSGRRRFDRVFAYRLATSATSLLTVRVVTPGVLIAVLRLVGLRLTVMEATRLVPLVGQAIAAGIAYLALTRLADRHIEDCLATVDSPRRPPPTA